MPSTRSESFVMRNNWGWVGAERGKWYKLWCAYTNGVNNWGVGGGGEEHKHEPSSRQRLEVNRNCQKVHLVQGIGGEVELMADGVGDGGGWTGERGWCLGWE